MRPGDEEAASIGKAAYDSPQEEVCVTVVEGMGMTGSARPAQEKGDPRQNLGFCFQGKERWSRQRQVSVDVLVGLRGLGLSGLLSLVSVTRAPWNRCVEPGLQLCTVYREVGFWATLGKNWVTLGAAEGPSLVREAHMQVHQKGRELASSLASQKLNKRSTTILSISCNTHWSLLSLPLISKCFCPHGAVPRKLIGGEWTLPPGREGSRGRGLRVPRLGS